MNYTKLKPTGIRSYLLGLVIALDILVNALLGGRIRTISERIGELKYTSRLQDFPIERTIDKFILEKVAPGHSIRAYLNNRRY